MKLFNRIEKRGLSINKVYEPYDSLKLFNVADGYDVYVSKLVQYMNLSGEISSSQVVFTRNIFIGDYTSPFYKPSIEVQKDYLFSLDNFRLFSYPNKVSVILGKWLDTPQNTNFIDITNKKINGYNAFFDINQTLAYQNYTYDPNWFIYIEKLLLISAFKPKYEFVLYPFTGNRLLPQIYMQFEYENKDQITYVVPIECKDGTYMADWDLPINRPKLMFSQDKVTWKVWDFSNNQWKNVSPDNNSYFTLDEFLSKAMTYTNYLNIPDNAFGDGDWYVMMNNYIPGFCLRMSYVEDFVGSARVVRINNGAFEDKLTIWSI